MKIRPAIRLRGTLRVPGDKSISHRAAIIAALASGASRLSGFSKSGDCKATLTCLAQLGVQIQRSGDDLHVAGSADTGLQSPNGPLDCGNSGTTMRLLTGLLAGQKFESTLTGDDSLRKRPMGRIIEPLEMMGAEIRSKHGLAPLMIQGQPQLKPIKYVMPFPSAQVKSCLLLAGLRAGGQTSVVEPPGAITRDHTERLLDWFGVPVAQSETGASLTWTITGPATFEARDVRIPGDFSSAAFFIGAAAMIPNSEVKVEEVGLNPTRTKLLEVLSAWGVAIEAVTEQDESNEPRGTIVVRGPAAGSRQQTVAAPLVSALIDELPLLAVIATQCGGISIRDAGELRTKECDRISAVVKNLRMMGVSVEEYDDGLSFSGPVELKGATIDSFGDHRIAMAFAVAALAAEGESEILGSDCVDVSFPGFFEVLESIVER